MKAIATVDFRFSNTVAHDAEIENEITNRRYWSDLVMVYDEDSDELDIYVPHHTKVRVRDKKDGRDVKISESVLQKEFDYYKAHQDELVELCCGKFVVVKNQALVGVYESTIEALEFSRGKYVEGTFLIQEVGPGPDLYTQTFYSPRVGPAKE